MKLNQRKLGNHLSTAFSIKYLTKPAGALSPSQSCLSRYTQEGLLKLSGLRRLLVVKAPAIASCPRGSHTRTDLAVWVAMLFLTPVLLHRSSSGLFLLDHCCNQGRSTQLGQRISVGKDRVPKLTPLHSIAKSHMTESSQRAYRNRSLDAGRSRSFTPPAPAS